MSANVMKKFVDSKFLGIFFQKKIDRGDRNDRKGQERKERSESE